MPSEPDRDGPAEAAPSPATAPALPDATAPASPDDSAAPSIEPASRAPSIEPAHALSIEPVHAPSIEPAHAPSIEPVHAPSIEPAPHAPSAPHSSSADLALTVEIPCSAQPAPSAPATDRWTMSSSASSIAASASTGLVNTALRTWLRYVVPLTLLSAIALAPALAITLRTPLPADQPAGLSTLWLGWKLIAFAVFCQLLLVGVATAATGEPLSADDRASTNPREPARPSQLAVLTRGFAKLVGALLPCLAAAATITIAGLALVVPALVMLVLLSLTGASTARGLPAPLLDSITIVRRHWRAVALAVLAMIALDLAIGFTAQRALLTIPVPRQPPAAQLAALRTFVRVIALALVVLSPIPATVLATLHRCATRSAR